MKRAAQSNAAFLGNTKLELSLWALAVFGAMFNDLPYFTATGEFGRTLSNYFIILLICISVWRGLKKKLLVKFHPAFRLFILFMAYAFIFGLIVSYLSPVVAFKDETIFVKTVKQWIVIFLGIAMAIYTSQVTLAPKGEKLLLRVLTVMFAVFAIVTVLQHLALKGLAVPHAVVRTIEPLYSMATLMRGIPYCEYYGRLNGTTLEASWAGEVVCCVFIPLAGYYLMGFGRKSRITGAVFLALCSWLLLVIGSRYALLCGFIEILVLSLTLAVFHRRFLLGAVLIFFVSLTVVASEDTYLGRYKQRAMTALVYSSDSSTVTRYSTMLVGLRIFEHHPVFGVGLGNNGFYFLRYATYNELMHPEIRGQVVDDTFWLDVKSVWVRLLSETGIVGLFLFVIPVIWLLISSGALLLDKRRDNDKPVPAAMYCFLSLLAIIITGFAFTSLNRVTWFVSLGWAAALASSGKKTSHGRVLNKGRKDDTDSRV